MFFSLIKVSEANGQCVFIRPFIGVCVVKNSVRTRQMALN